jgi:diguanylate cyclase (GGDEF)-like protein
MRPIPEPLEPLLQDPCARGEGAAGHVAGNGPVPLRETVALQHKLGYTLHAIARRTVLRDAFGGRIGTAIAFHPSEALDALPHGEAGHSQLDELEASQAELEERLGADFDDFVRSGIPLGVLWIGVDQAESMHRTHGEAAYNSMVDKVERTLKQGLRPTEHIGRWGDGEFLVLAHECTAKTLESHAHTLAGLARTADFRWWGDRVTITVSIGAAQVHSADDMLPDVLERAGRAMVVSNQAGGNRVTLAARSCSCSPS